MLILMGAYREGHLIGTQIALAAALAAAPDFERVCCVNRDNVAALHSLSAAWPLVHTSRQRSG
jgi:hypothetical protein